MPVKEKSRRSHHVTHKKEKRTKHFLKVYAPYIPLLLIVGCGLFMAGDAEFKRSQGTVASYATDVSDSGLLEETNEMRTREGLQPLTFDNALDQSAQAKADDMKKRDYWSHATPDGQQPWEFISNYSYAKAAENLAYGFNSSHTTVAGWMNSQAHRANIMDADLQDVGFGIVNVPDYQGNGPETLIVAFYGEPSVLAGSSQPLNLSNEAKDISYVQSVTAGRAPWAGLAAGILIGCIAMYLVLTHAHRLRKLVREGERFVVHHPLFDITLVALMALAALASQSVGKIY